MTNLRYPVVNIAPAARPLLGQAKRNPWDWLPPTPPVPPGAPQDLHDMAAKCEELRRKYGSFPRGAIMLTSVEQDIEEIEQDRMDAFYDWWICDGRLRKLIDQWTKSPRRPTLGPVIPEFTSPFACPLKPEPTEGPYPA